MTLVNTTLLVDCQSAVVSGRPKQSAFSSQHSAHPFRMGFVLLSEARAGRSLKCPKCSESIAATCLRSKTAVRIRACAYSERWLMDFRSLCGCYAGFSHLLLLSNQVWRSRKLALADEVEGNVRRLVPGAEQIGKSEPGKRIL